MVNFLKQPPDDWMALVGAMASTYMASTAMRRISQPAHVGTERNRAANDDCTGMRAFCFIAPLWRLGRLLLAGAVVCLLFFFYHRDRAPRSDEDLMG